jgi:hypothetical protein
MQLQNVVMPGGARFSTDVEFVPAVSEVNAAVTGDERQRTIQSYDIRELREAGDLESLRQEWGDLLARVSHRSFLHELPWSAAISEKLLPGRVSYYCVFDSAKLIAVVPIEKRTAGFGWFRIRWLQFPTQSNIYLSDIVLDQSYSGSRIVAAVLGHIFKSSGFYWDYCRLRKFCPRSAVYAQLRQEGKQLREVGGHSYIPCRDVSDLKNISKKMWKNTSRLANKAATEIGPVSMACSDPILDSDTFYQDFVEIESSGWKGSDGSNTGLACDPLANRFFQSLMVDSADQWHARVFTLRFGEHKVASLLAIQSNATWYILKIGYLEEYREYGPGSILLQLFIDAGAKDPDIVEINLTTAPAWADRWHFDRAPLYEALFFSPTFRARFCSVYFGLKAAIVAAQSRTEMLQMASEQLNIPGIS